MQAANWLVGLMLLSIMAIKLLWGFDLVLVAHLVAARQRDALADGMLWLGWYFVVSALFVFGALGYLLIRDPHEAVPLWFAIPCAVATLDCVMAWHLLGPSEHYQKGGTRDDIA